MSKEQLQAFLEAIKGDTALQARIQDTTVKRHPELVLRRHENWPTL
jgi:hypothetical protein